MTDYMFSLPGGLLNKGYSLEKCFDFLMERGELYLVKPLHQYNRKLVLDVIHFLVRFLLHFSQVLLPFVDVNVCLSQCPAINPLQAVKNHLDASVIRHCFGPVCFGC